MPVDHEAWYHRAFAADYALLYGHRDQAEAVAVVSDLLGWLQLPDGARCLDLCCGAGRHLAALRRHGLSACGLDLSPEQLAAAAALPECRGRLVRGDMRRLPFAQCFDAVFSFFSSFGYFADDSENEAVIREISRVLKPGGQLLIDYLNPPQVVATLRSEDRRQDERAAVVQKRWIDVALNTVEKDVTISDAAGERHYHERVKLYGPGDFARFFAAAGLSLSATTGDPSGAPYAEQSPRQVIRGRKDAG